MTTDLGELLLETIENLNYLLKRERIDSSEMIDQLNRELDQMQDDRDEEIVVYQSLIEAHPELKPEADRHRTRYREQHS